MNPWAATPQEQFDPQTTPTSPEDVRAFLQAMSDQESEGMQPSWGPDDFMPTKLLTMGVMAPMMKGASRKWLQRAAWEAMYDAARAGGKHLSEREALQMAVRDAQVLGRQEIADKAEKLLAQRADPKLEKLASSVGWETNYPVINRVKVTPPGSEPFIDFQRGMNPGHADWLGGMTRNEGTSVERLGTFKDADKLPYSPEARRALVDRMPLENDLGLHYQNKANEVALRYGAKPKFRYVTMHEPGVPVPMEEATDRLIRQKYLETTLKRPVKNPWGDPVLADPKMPWNKR